MSAPVQRAAGALLPGRAAESLGDPVDDPPDAKGADAVGLGPYENRILPRILDAACGAKTLEPLRRRVCAGLAGDVVEIGFGSGLNVPFYPSAVTRVAAVEPADASWKLARKRLVAASVPVQRSGLDGQGLPFEDGRYDALRGRRRLLKPGAPLHFVDPGLPPAERTRRWQRRLDPVQRRLAGGC